MSGPASTGSSQVFRHWNPPGASSWCTVPWHDGQVVMRRILVPGRATEQVRAGVGGDARANADATWSPSDFLSSALRVVEGRCGPLTVAATEYDRAARELWGLTPPRSSAGQGLWTASACLSAARRRAYARPQCPPVRRSSQDLTPGKGDFFSSLPACQSTPAY